MENSIIELRSEKRRKLNSYAVDEACTDLSLDIKCDKLQRTMHRKGQKAGQKK